MNDLKQLIGEFLQTVPSGTIIDAHTVIDTLCGIAGMLTLMVTNMVKVRLHTTAESVIWSANLTERF